MWQNGFAQNWVFEFYFFPVVPKVESKVYHVLVKDYTLSCIPRIFFTAYFEMESHWVEKIGHNLAL